MMTTPCVHRHGASILMGESIEAEHAQRICSHSLLNITRQACIDVRAKERRSKKRVLGSEHITFILNFVGQRQGNHIIGYCAFLFRVLLFHEYKSATIIYNLSENCCCTGYIVGMAMRHILPIRAYIRIYLRIFAHYPHHFAFAAYAWPSLVH